MSYPDLSQITDPALRQALKVFCDRLNAQEALRRVAPAMPSPAIPVDWGHQRLASIASPVQPQDGITRQFLETHTNVSIQQAIQFAQQHTSGTHSGVSTGGGTGGGNVPPPSTPPGGGGPLPCHNDLLAAQGSIPPFGNLRWFRGNFIGIRVPGLPFVKNGSSTDLSLVTSFFLDRYSPSDQNNILTAYKGRGLSHFVLSWPDSRDGNGQSIAQYVATAQLVQSFGLNPVHFFFSKDYDGQNPDITKADAVISALNAAGALVIGCVGWELNEIFGDGTLLQPVIDRLTGNPGNWYVHFSPGIPFWGKPGDTGAIFWGNNVGKLQGLLHQKVLSWPCGLYQAKLNDIQVRFNGGAGWPHDSGFGHPFDIVAFECTASDQFFNNLSERDGDVVGFQALCTPGPIPIYGYCNGATGSP